jgi:hypothetical protein
MTDGPEAQSLKRRLVVHLALSVATSLVVGGLILAFDLGGVRTMALSTGDGPLVAVLLVLGLLSTFGILALVGAVMTFPRVEANKD